MDRAKMPAPLATQWHHEAARCGVQADRGRTSPALQPRWAEVINASACQVAQRHLMQRLFGLGGRAPAATAGTVVQLGGKYDSVFSQAKSDADKDDYAYGSVSDKDYVEAADELIAEHLQAGYVGHDGKDVVVPKAQMDKKGWGGAPGIVFIPERSQGLNMMMGSNTFLPALIHEAAHFAVEGKGQQAGLKEAVAKLAALAGDAAESGKYDDANPDKTAWIEESRADLTSIYLRYVRDGKKPAETDYESLLGGEAADTEHPPGEVRLQLIGMYLKTLP